ncbi:MAG: dihydrofolate synthase / folylpolyglutamate synthase [Solirubrobacteraceae bacterium]|nr:dihydrofolate synthase / folylpolyglutamate synthase [Solirubrobacteraceae bacterium]
MSPADGRRRPIGGVASGSGWTAAAAERYLLGLELFGMRFGLSRMRRLMSVLDAPNERFASVHVVGSNGKSSTTRMIAALLEGHGHATGAYTSPHLVDFAERIQVGGRDVTPGRFAAAVERAAHAAQLVDRNLGADDRVTQFEALTAAAYLELAAAGVAVAVIEAGLGGRYDATNVIDSKVQVLTNVALEHTRWLGPRIIDIAAEKLDVVRPGGVLVLGPDLHPDALAVARRVAGERGARIVVAPVDVPESGLLRARGAYQRRNLAVAVAAAEAYLERPLDPPVVRRVAADLVVPGRFQVLDAGDPVTVLDGAHNPSGAIALAESLPAFLAGRPLSLVVSILDDKDAAAMLAALLPLCSRLIVTAAASPRALSPATLASLASQLDLGPAAEIEPDPRRALAGAREEAGGGVVLATGSLYLIADLLRPPGAGPGSIL